MTKQIGSVEEYFGVVEPYSNKFTLTKNSTLLGAIEIGGRDPDGMTSTEHAAFCAIAQSIYGSLDRRVGITEYYSHFDGVKVTLRRRGDPISDTLSQRREQYLNDQNLNGSRIVHYIELEPVEDVNRLSPVDFLKHCGLALFEKRSRVLLKHSATNRVTSAAKAFLIEREQLDHMRTKLQDVIDEIQQKWAGLFSARQLSTQEMWAHMRFLATLQPQALVDGMKEAVPEEDMDIELTSGDIANVQVEKMEVLKLPGVTNVYAKLASVRRFARKGGKMLPGLWASGESSPIRVAGNYVIMTHWRPMTELQRDLLFRKKNTELERSTLNLFDLLGGKESQSNLDKEAGIKPAIKKKMQDLGIAESLPDVWGIGYSVLCVFGENPKQVRATATEMGAVLGNSRIGVTWESISIKEAFASLQPGQSRMSERDLYMTSSQFAAASLIYKSSPGQPVVPDLKNEEACYVLRSKDGTPFHYSSFINGRSMVVGIGPIRKGKTFFKNTLATHSQKYGGIYRAVDIDPGTEPIAGVFGADAGIFRSSKDAGSGANPFASCRGADDVDFKIHMLTLLKLMLETNDTPSYRQIDEDEQEKIGAAIANTMKLPPEMQNLSTCVAHMPEKTQLKFARWVRPNRLNNSADAGWYAHLLDCDKDGIGALDKRVGVFNLQSLKESPALLRPVLADILYRITQAIEDPARRNQPKTLDIDEAHYALGLPGFPGYLEQKIRTWGKWFGSVQMWTQSVSELMAIDGWPALRSAASTFIFFSDPEMDEALYRKAFPFLTAGECEAIRNLIPQKQAYIIQSEIGVSKVIVIDVEPAQRVVNTSHPREAALRDSLIKKHGFEEGLRLAVAELEPALKRDPEDDVYSRLELAA